LLSVSILLYLRGRERQAIRKPKGGFLKWGVGGDIKQERKQWMKQVPTKVRLSIMLNKEVGISVPVAD